MELTVNIDETKFNELIQGELQNFTQEELHEICKESFMKCLSNVDTFKTLFVERDPSSYYNNYSEKYHANDLLKEAARKVDLNPLFKDFQDQVVKYLKDNHDSIIKELMTDIFISGMSNFMYDSGLTRRMREEFAMQINNMQNQTDQKIHNALSQL